MEILEKGEKEVAEEARKVVDEVGVAARRKGERTG